MTQCPPAQCWALLLPLGQSMHTFLLLKILHLFWSLSLTLQGFMSPYCGQALRQAPREVCRRPQDSGNPRASGTEMITFQCGECCKVRGATGCWAMLVQGTPSSAWGGKQHLLRRIQLRSLTQKGGVPVNRIRWPHTGPRAPGNVHHHPQFNSNCTCRLQTWVHLCLQALSKEPSRRLGFL